MFVALYNGSSSVAGRSQAGCGWCALIRVVSTLHPKLNTLLSGSYKGLGCHLAGHRKASPSPSAYVPPPSFPPSNNNPSLSIILFYAESKPVYTEEDYQEQLDIPPPPLPPKPSHAAPQGGHFNRRPPQSHVLTTSSYDKHANFRQRATSHDSRPSARTGRGSGIAGGSTGSFRGRLSSDGSSSAQSSGALRGGPPSTAGTERQERSLSPPNTPPPPYTEFDHGHHRKPPPPPTSNGNRQFSLSQQEPAPSAYSSTHMQRTRSHGQVPYRRVNIHRVATTPSGPGGDEIGGGQRVNPPMKSPATELEGGGTLV